MGKYQKAKELDDQTLSSAQAQDLRLGREVAQENFDKNLIDKDTENTTTRFVTDPKTGKVTAQTGYKGQAGALDKALKSGKLSSLEKYLASSPTEGATSATQARLAQLNAGSKESKDADLSATQARLASQGIPPNSPAYQAAINGVNAKYASQEAQNANTAYTGGQADALAQKQALGTQLQTLNASQMADTESPATPTYNNQFQSNAADQKIAQTGTNASVVSGNNQITKAQSDESNPLSFLSGAGQLALGASKFFSDKEIKRKTSIDDIMSNPKLKGLREHMSSKELVSDIDEKEAISSNPSHARYDSMTPAQKRLYRAKVNGTSQAEESLKELVSDRGEKEAIPSGQKEPTENPPEEEQLKGKGAVEAIDKMPVTAWKYKEDSVADDGGEPHVGTMAQNFQEATGVGDGKTIDQITMNGYMTAAIQELHDMVKELQGQKSMKKSEGENA